MRRFKYSWMFLLLVIAIVSNSRTAAAGGINLSWDDCGSAGLPSKSFACNVNSGVPFTMIGSFVPEPGMVNFVGINAEIDITAETGTLPDWWKHGTGQCRSTNGLSTGFDFTAGPFTCADIYAGQVGGGFLYTVGAGGPNRAHLRLQAAIPSDHATPIDENTEYYAFKLNIMKSKSTGAGSCAGCSTPALVTLESMTLYGVDDSQQFLDTPLNSTEAGWNNPLVPFTIDATDLSDPEFRLSGSACLPSTQVQPVTLYSGNYSFVSCETGGQFNFRVESSGVITYAPELEPFLDGNGTAALVVHGYPIQIDTQAFPSLVYKIGPGTCVNGGQVQSLRVVPSAFTFNQGACGLGGQFVFNVDAAGLVQYDPSLEPSLDGAGTQTLVVTGRTVHIDTQIIPSSTQLNGGDCVPGQVRTFETVPGPFVVATCGVATPGCEKATAPVPMAFAVDPGGNFTYAAALQGSLSGAGTNTLQVRSFSFPPGGDDFTGSMGLFRIVIEPAFWELLADYPGFGKVKWVRRLVSPAMFDPGTRIGRSSIHMDGDAADVGGTPVGTAGTIVKDSDFITVPPGFQGPNGTPEVHTEIRSLNMTAPFAGGTVAVRAGTSAPSRPKSPGEIQADPGVNGLFPAESFFNVFVEVDLPALGTLYNTEPLLVENSGISCFPPEVVYLHKHTGPVPIVFKNDDLANPKRWHQNDRLGWLVLAGHGINFDTVSTVASLNGVRTYADPFAEFAAIVNAESEMENVETTQIDVHDVITFAPPSAFVLPSHRDSIENGIAAAVFLGQSGDPCAGTRLISDLYARVDGLNPPLDWVTDAETREALADRIHAVGRQLQIQANQSGGCLPTAVGDEKLPTRIALVGIQPNPSNGNATIQYALPTRTHVKIAVYDLSGRMIRSVVDSEIEAGMHRAVWDGNRDRASGRAVPSGTYFVRMTAGGVTQMKRMVILR